MWFISLEKYFYFSSCFINSPFISPYDPGFPGSAVFRQPFSRSPGSFWWEPVRIPQKWPVPSGRQWDWASGWIFSRTDPCSFPSGHSESIMFGGNHGPPVVRMEDQCIIHVSDHAQGFVPGFLGGQSLIHPFLGNVEGLVELPGKCSSVLYENLVFPFLFVCTLRFSIYRIKC